jgi:transposase InsO family protein
LLSFYRYGAPKKLLSDQGREFVNTINADLAKKINIDRMITAAYRPQTNGLDER